MENSTISSITNNLSEPLFARIFATSPRKAREILFSRYGVKAKKRIGLPNPSDNAEKVRKLHDKFKIAKSPQEMELLKELIRNWLFTRRPMLKSALDHLGVANNDGLIDEDPEFFTKLDQEKAKELFKHLVSAQFDPEEARVYLKFMDVAHDFDS